MALAPAAARGQKVRLDDGRILTGKVLPTTGVVDNADVAALQAGQKPTGPILLVDDELRRVFVCRYRVQEVMEQALKPPVTLRPWQNPSQGAAKLVSVGPALGITPFDEFGRRVYEMQLGIDRLSIVQGITELTPYYAKVEALSGPQKSIAWDYRMATSSIPRETLAAILVRVIPQDDWEKRLGVVRFHTQAERYGDARRELERIIQEFPDKKDLQSEVTNLRQAGARQLLKELELRRAAGQHQFVTTLLNDFPSEEVAGETLVQVRQVMRAYDQADLRIKAIGERLQATVAAIADADHRGLAAPIAEEVIRELSHNTVDRLGPFVQFLDDASLTAEEKTALALSGWLLGGEEAVRDLPAAIALVKVRDLVMRYLREPLPSERQPLADEMTSLDGSTVDRLAKLILRMKPPWHDPAQSVQEGACLELSAPGQTEDGDFQYLIQLPPQYDPYRYYPTLVVLNGAYNTPEQELDFWAGSQPPALNNQPGVRRGQAMRHGYITIAVDWHKPHQYEYEYTAREHVAVLTCLRDASRRFSIDADRVYLSGHDVGGEAAWDMAQAHPDLWAGAIPFGPRAEEQQKYLGHYRENAQYVPLYFVAGELDGRTIAQNAPIWDVYLRSKDYDTTLVEFRGRGHEPFYDEIHQLFQWMSLKRRGRPPAKFACSTLRPWDNFFWWLECEEFPEHHMIYPTDWSGRRVTPAVVQGRLQSENRLWAKTPAGRTTIWLNPDLVDFSKPIRVTFDGRKLAEPEGGIQPNPIVLLEDVRTRADRQRPFWAKIDVP